MFSLRTLLEAMEHGTYFTLFNASNNEIIGSFRYDRITPDMFFLPYIKWLDMCVILFKVHNDTLFIYLQ